MFARISAQKKFCAAATLVMVLVGSGRLANAQPDAEVLSNAAIVQMVLGKVPKDVITQKINGARPGFDLSSSGLVMLSQNRVDQSLIKAMLLAAEDARQKGAAPATLTGLDEILTNESVVRMLVGKLPKPLIFGKIQSSRSTFDMSATGLVKLKENNVPSDVMKAMMAPPAVAAAVSDMPVREASATSAVVAAKEPPKAEPRARVAEVPKPIAKPKSQPSLARIPTEAGIHLYEATDHGDQFTAALEAKPYTGNKTSGRIGNAITGGLSKVKMRAQVQGTEANVVTQDQGIEFYFIFEKATTSPANRSPMITVPTSPNEYSLLRMNVVGNHRELVVGSENALGTESGTETKANVPFKYTRIRPGVYRVVPTLPLPPGQYAFLPPPTIAYGNAGAAGATSLYDFTVR